jgi:hypothetical protein
VASSYIEKCTGLWIVAPITRAVDDRIARNLMTESFGRQLQLDGGYSAVTFVCPKTDDISQKEAFRIMPKSGEVTDLRNCLKETESEVKRIERVVGRIESEMKQYGREMEELDKKLSCVNSALRRAKTEQDEEILLVSPSASRKRRPQTNKPAPRKKAARKTDESDCEMDSDSDSDDSDEFVTTTTEEEKETLSKDAAEELRDNIISRKEELAQMWRAKKGGKK